MRRLAWIPAALASVMLLLVLVYASVASFAFDTRQYPQTPPYDEMADELAGYLSEKQPSLSEELFTERERLHMEDVLALFVGGRRIATGCLVGAVILLALAFFLGRRRALGFGLLAGIGLFLGIVLFVAVWAAIDFDGWFRTMHELVFTNDLWLLDPADSMLINMLPLDFFIGAVRTIALRFGLGALVMALTGFAMQYQRKGTRNAVSG